MAEERAEPVSPVAILAFQLEKNSSYPCTANIRGVDVSCPLIQQILTIRRVMSGCF